LFLTVILKQNQCSKLWVPNWSGWWQNNHILLRNVNKLVCGDFEPDPYPKGQLKWAYLCFWELENDMRKSLFRYERCQALPAEKKYIQREYEMEILPCLNVIVPIQNLWACEVCSWPTQASGHNPHVRQHNPQEQLYPNMKSCFTAKSLLPCKAHTAREIIQQENYLSLTWLQFFTPANFNGAITRASFFSSTLHIVVASIWRLGLCDHNLVLIQMCAVAIYLLVAILRIFRM